MRYFLSLLALALMVSTAWARGRGSTYSGSAAGPIILLILCLIPLAMWGEKIYRRVEEKVRHVFGLNESAYTTRRLKDEAAAARRRRNQEELEKDPRYRSNLTGLELEELSYKMSVGDDSKLGYYKGRKNRRKPWNRTKW
jgi:hypothetical protein